MRSSLHSHVSSESNSSQQGHASSYNFSAVLAYIRQVVRPFWPAMLFSMVLVLIESVVTIYLVPDQIKAITDINPEKVDASHLAKALCRPILLFLILQVCVEVIARMHHYVFSVRTVPLLRARVLSGSVQKALNKSYSFYEKEYPGKLSESLVRLSNAVPEVVELTVVQLLACVTNFLFAIYKLYYIEKILGVLLMLFCVFIVVTTFFFNKKLTFLSNQWMQKCAIVAGRVVDILSNILSIKLFSTKTQERKKLNKLLSGSVNTEGKLQWTYLYMFLLFGIGYFILQAVSFYLLIQKAAQGRVSIGDVVSVLYIHESLITLVWYDLPDLSVLSKHLGSIQQVLRVIHKPTVMRDEPQAKPLKCTEGAIRFDHVYFSFQPSAATPFFEDMTLEIPAKQKVGIVGYSGSGKSTLIKLLLRLYDIQSGEITIDGQNIAHVTQSSLRDCISVVTQSPSLFHRSLKENISCGSEKVSEEAIVKAAKQARAHDFIMATEGGYDALAGEQGLLLSGGQRQRILIARAMLKDARIFILDEATSQLDSLTESEIQEMLFLLMKNKTTLVIAHRLSTLLKMDRILVFDQGKIVEDGSHEVLLGQNGLYKRLWDSQMHGFIPDYPAGG